MTEGQATISKMNYRVIGKGFCGSVWANPSKANTGSYAMKREDGGKGRSLLNDWQMHKIIYDSLKRLKAQGCSLDIIITTPHAYIPASDQDWWSKRASRFPSDHSHCNTLISSRVPPLARPAQERIIQKYCPHDLVDMIRNNPKDEDCMAKIYLGRRRVGNPTSRFKAFTNRNFPLHIDQMEDLGIDPLEYANTMADGLAAMHWVAKVDANDVEFVAASLPVDHEKNDPAPFSSRFLGDHALWLIDFDCCHPMSMDEAGIGQAVAAFYKNDPYYPRPNQSENERDRGLWSAFRKRFLETSASFLGGGDIAHLPELFIRRLEERGKELAAHKSKLSRD